MEPPSPVSSTVRPSERASLMVSASLGLLSLALGAAPKSIIPESGRSPLFWLLVASAVAVALWGLYPQRWTPQAIRRRRTERRQAEEERQRAGDERLEQEALLVAFRQTWRGPCRAWDAFHVVGGLFVHTADTFRPNKGPENWREVLSNTLRDILPLAARLHLWHRTKAACLLSRFDNLSIIKSPDDLAFPLADLRNWLFETDLFYRRVKKEAGWPELEVTPQR